MQADVVIGANFGDECKGLMTDYLAAPYGRNCIVVRFNGGAQAGHTVVTPERRHVFHHFGSGTLTGAATFLSQFFIVNPFLWAKEHEELASCNPSLIIDPHALLSTPYDMLINQEVERFRATKHGSCGVGIHETIVRAESGYATRANNLKVLGNLRWCIQTIRHEYVPQRLAELGIDNPSDWFMELLESDTLINSFIAQCERLVEKAIFQGESIFSEYEHVVFEGAQGLLLDQDHEFYPHVTHDHTGLANVHDIAKRTGIKKLCPIYVTRWYMTRHGAGPFPTENPEMSFPDPTNAANEWQGQLRFGELDLDLLRESIVLDCGKAHNIDIEPCLAVTCLDQCAEADSQLEHIQERSPVPVKFTSYGDTRSTVQQPGPKQAGLIFSQEGVKYP